IEWLGLHSYSGRPGTRFSSVALCDDAGMRCEVAREALSARMDGEQPQVLAQQVDAHLESCGRCRAWLIGAAAQTRRLSRTDAGHGPDLTDKILATATAPRRRWLPGP